MVGVLLGPHIPQMLYSTMALYTSLFKNMYEGSGEPWPEEQPCPDGFDGSSGAAAAHRMPKDFIQVISPLEPVSPV